MWYDLVKFVDSISYYRWRGEFFQHFQTGFMPSNPLLQRRFWASMIHSFGPQMMLFLGRLKPCINQSKKPSLPSAQSTNVKPVSRATLASFRLVNRNVHHVSRGGFAESHWRWLPQATDEWANGTGGQRAVKLEVRERVMIIGNYRKSLEIKGLKEIR